MMRSVHENLHPAKISCYTVFCKYPYFYQRTLLFISGYDPCDNIRCSAGARCVSSNASCVCKSLEECPQDKGHTVCGSDGRTYPSRCHLQVTACKDQTNVFYEHKGKCPGKEFYLNGVVDLTWGSVFLGIIYRCRSWFTLLAQLLYKLWLIL